MGKYKQTIAEFSKALFKKNEKDQAVACFTTAKELLEMGYKKGDPYMEYCK